MLNKHWLRSYPPEVHADIDTEKYASVPDLLRSSFERYGDAPAYSSHGKTLSFFEVDRFSRAFASYLLNELGLKRGDRVAVMLPNLLQSPVTIFGILRAGLVVVNVNPMYTARELRDLLIDSGARSIVVLENFAATVAESADGSAIESVIVSKLGDHFPGLKRVAANFFIKYVKRLVPRAQVDRAVDYRSCLKAGAGRPSEDLVIDGGELAFLQYTGGTTGAPKAAMLSHGNIVSNTLQAAAWVGPYLKASDGAAITALPLYHIYALTANLFVPIEIGLHTILIANPRDLKALVATLKSNRFSAITGVNTLFAKLLETPGFDGIDFSALKVCLGGGTAVHRGVAERWNQVTGTTISQGYGLTEASPIVSANPIVDFSFDGSVGLPLPATDIAILDDARRKLGWNEIGEICVRGPQVMKAYWNRERDTVEAFTEDGWFMTGDLGRIDDRGRLFIEDRKKDVINVSGFNVYPNEIEDVVGEHPDVLEAAAIGVTDESTGEAVKLFVVRSGEHLSEQALIDYCRSKLTNYKIPRHVIFMDSLPKTNVGKVLRRELRA